MDNHQLVWVVLKYEFIDNRPTFGEDQDENEDKKTITMKVVNNLKLIDKLILYKAILQTCIS